MEFVLKKLNDTLTLSDIVNVHFFEFPADFCTQYDSHPFYELVYVDNAELYIESDSYKGLLRKNQMIIHNIGENHRFDCIDNIPPVVIIIDFLVKNADMSFFSKSPVTLSASEIKSLSEIVKEGRNVFKPPYNVPLYDMKMRKHQPFGAQQMLKNNIENFLLSLMRKYVFNASPAETVTSEKIKITEIISYLDANYREKILLDELAFLFLTNRTTLCKEFRKKTGVTVNRYINQKKLSKALALLKETDLSVTAISEQLNFDSIHYFTKFFTKETGISPSAYRSQNRSDTSAPKG